MPRVLNVGSLNLDLVYRVAHIVRSGETLATESFTCLPGGKGLNQSVALARAGVEVCHFGAVGQDGGSLLEVLREAGADVSLVATREGETGRAMIQCDHGGENAILLQPGVNHELEGSRLLAAMDAMQSGDYLLLQNETNLVLEAVREGNRRGLVVCWNAAPFSPLARQVSLEEVHVLIVNETEAEGLSGEVSPQHALQALARRMPTATIVVTLGAEGSLVWQNEKTFAVPACPCPEVVDTTAAGDTFTGYLLASMLLGSTLPDSLVQASRAAAWCIARPGAAPSIPTRECLKNVW